MIFVRSKKKFPKIKSVEAFNDDCFAITLSNGHTIWWELKERIQEPQFKQLIEKETFHKPKTDGKRVYWEDGPSFELGKIFSIITLDNHAIDG